MSSACTCHIDPEYCWWCLYEGEKKEKEQLKQLQYELSSHVINKDKNIDHLLKENARLQVNIFKSKNGIPTVIEFNGQRYILQHPDHRGRKK